jgi:hypothetical protein
LLLSSELYVGLHRGKDFEAKGKKDFHLGGPTYYYYSLTQINTYKTRRNINILVRSTKVTPVEE